MARQRPEQALQIQVARFLSVALKPPVVWSAIGHGGGGRVRGAQLKAMGLRKGMPDFIIIAPGCDGYMGELTPLAIGLELKSPAGRQSAEQRALQAKWEECGGKFAVVRSLDEVASFLSGTGVPLHASLSSPPVREKVA